ncbi:hypothetical protein GQ55_6G187400 [Panicum hallii var. hallii]|jgi:hypothetical protein|uniref:Uncharacterized protein n=1 Tax=Panicum hallii var. hallii TaxID=1504633 RepID=A0A2T7D783_9POAL|nr:hypothetical protein GQ55_6G187400 [Panicum hallii var. hallii]
MAAPVAAVAARARSVGIPRGWLAALAALVALLLGATWVMVAAHIAGAVGRCLAAEGGPAWAEDKCRHLMTYPPAVAVVSLALTLVLCVREARAESKVRKVGRCSVLGGFARRLLLPRLICRDFKHPPRGFR